MRGEIGGLREESKKMHSDMNKEIGGLYKAMHEEVAIMRQEVQGVREGVNVQISGLHMELVSTRQATMVIHHAVNEIRDMVESRCPPPHAPLHLSPR